MRQPPPLRDLPHYPVVGGLAMLAVAVTLAGWAELVDLSPLKEDHHIREGEVWRLATTILPHVNILHLAFNVYWLWAFGSLVEERFGHARTLGLVLLLAVGSSAADYALSHGGVGLSGVGYGLFGFLWVLSRRDQRFGDAVDPQTVTLFVAWFFLCIVATAAGIWNIANLAHAAGAVLGGLVGLAVAAAGLRPVYGTLVGLLLLAAGAAVYARPYINLTGQRAYDRARLGYNDLVNDRHESAVRHFRAAIESAKDAPEAGWWFNLGLAHQKRGDYAAAKDAYQRAAEMDPSENDFREALAYAERMLQLDRVRALHEDIDHRTATPPETQPATPDGGGETSPDSLRPPDDRN